MLNVFLRLLAAIYREGEPNAVRLHPVPRHRDLAVIMTHDIDAQTSMANAIQYAQFEKSQGIVGTYFVQTKYIKDFNDEVSLNAQGIKDMAALHWLGMELASHTGGTFHGVQPFPTGNRDGALSGISALCEDQNHNGKRIGVRRAARQQVLD